MDKLRSEHDKVCAALSADPDYILQQCGDILSMNEFLEVQKQRSALHKMRVPLKIIIQKGGDTCQCFVDILRKHEGHYQQQLLNPNTEESATPTMHADGNSVITARQITNVTAKSLSMKIKTVSDAGSRRTGNVVGQVPPADYTAQDASVVSADKYSGLTIDGDINLSVSVKSSKVCAGTIDETPPASQGPAVRTVREHKVELIECLRADHAFILQHVHAKHIVTDRQYQNLKHISQPEKSVTDLIDHVIVKGQESCSLFLEVLKEPEVLRTFPQLRLIIKNSAKQLWKCNDIKIT